MNLEPEEPPAQSQTPAGERNTMSSMVLLQTIWDSALDPGYSRFAERKDQSFPLWRKIVIVVLMTALTFGTTIAVKNLRSFAAVQEQVEQGLFDQIDAEQDTIATLTLEISTLNQQILTDDSTEASSVGTNPHAELAAATAPIRGQGVVVTLEETAPGPNGEGAIRDTDLRFVINLLWFSGAEAIAVGGIRLGPDTTVRTAGSAILVDLQPVNDPYLIEAVGDAAAMKTKLTSGPDAAKFNQLMANLGVQTTVNRSESLLLPASGAPQTKLAQILTGEVNET